MSVEAVSRQHTQMRSDVLAELLVHREHRHLVRLEHRPEQVVTYNLPFVRRVLEVMALDVVPQTLDDLTAGKSLSVK